MSNLYSALLERNASPFYPGGVLPSYDGHGTVNLAQSLLAYFGSDHAMRLAAHAEFTKALGGKQKVLLLILDGLGWLNLERAMQRRPAIRRLLDPAWRMPLTTIFPSTTSAAMTSLMTGVPPAVHGVLGFMMAFPEYGRVFNMLTFRTPDAPQEDLCKLGFQPDDFIPVPSITERLRALNILTGSFTFNAYADSGLSHFLYPGQRPYIYHGIGDLLATVRDRIAVSGPQFTSLYWSQLDSIAHVYGADSEAYTIELLAILRALYDEILPHLDNAVLLITADHGHLDGDEGDSIILNNMPDVVNHFRLPPAGEGRAQQLFLDAHTQDLVCNELLAYGNLHVLTKAEVLAHALFGSPMRPGWEERLGDLLVLPCGARRTLFDYQPRVHTAMRGRHGGLSPEEMVVPLLVMG